MTDQASRIIAWRQLSERIPFTRQHVLRLEKAGRFPKRIRLGERRCGWVEAEIEDFLAARMRERNRPTPCE